MKTLFPGSSLVAGVLTTVLAFSAIVPLTKTRAAQKHHITAVQAGSLVSPADAWKIAQDAAKEIETDVAEKNLDSVHSAQDRLEDALVYIQENVRAGAENAPLTGALENAIAASKKLHESSDAGDQAKTEANLKTLKTTLSLVEEQLPSAGVR